MNRKEAEEILGMIEEEKLMDLIYKYFNKEDKDTLEKRLGSWCKNYIMTKGRYPSKEEFTLETSKIAKEISDDMDS